MKKILFLTLAILALAAGTASAGRILVVENDLGEVGTTNPLPVAEAAYGEVYSASPSTAFVIDAVTNPALDFFTITGSDDATVYVHEITLTGLATAATNVVVQVVRRSSANTGGTSATVTASKRDSSNPTPPLATVRQYTDVAAGTSFVAGTSAGMVLTRHFAWDRTAPAAAVHMSDQRVTFDPPVVLNGAAEVLALSLPSAAGPAGNTTLPNIVWSEVRH
jgi:hypothetical protein